MTLCTLHGIPRTEPAVRGTKATAFLRSDSSNYVVVDLPEAIFSNLG